MSTLYVIVTSVQVCQSEYLTLYVIVTSVQVCQSEYHICHSNKCTGVPV